MIPSTLALVSPICVDSSVASIEEEIGLFKEIQSWPKRVDHQEWRKELWDELQYDYL